MARPTRERLPEVRLDLAEGPLILFPRVNRRARRIALKVEADGRAVLVLPAKSHLRAGLAFARDRGTWLHRQIAALAPHVPFADGAAIPILGELHIIRHRPAMRHPVMQSDGEILVSGDVVHLPRRLQDWFKREAKNWITPQARRLAAELDRRPAAITIRDTRTRWGSCSASGRLSFSWRLLLAPAAVGHYLVAHEVCHLREHNHSGRFWDLVARLDPDYRQAEAWLKRHGHDLHRYG